MAPPSGLVRSCAAALVALLVASGPPAGSSPDAAAARGLPDAIANVLDAPAFPDPFVSPARDAVLLATPLRFPPAADVARRVHLAGATLDPLEDGSAAAPAYTALRLLRIADGSIRDVLLPPGARAGPPTFSEDGARFAFANAGSHGSELVIGSVAAAEASVVPGIRLNTMFDDAVTWLPGKDALLLHVSLEERPPENAAPGVPTVRESRTVRVPFASAGVARDERGAGGRFAAAARGAYAILDLASGHETLLTEPGVYAAAKASPDGRLIAFEHLEEPLSDAATWPHDAHRTVVIDRTGRAVAAFPEVPLDADADPHAPPAGPRDVAWQANAPATLVWVEAGANGRDVVYARDVGARDRPRAVLGTAGRLENLAFLEGTSVALAREYERETKTSHTVEFDVNASRDGARAESFDPVRDGDAFDDPGTPLTRPGPGGEPVVIRDGNAIFLSGAGYTTAGLRPFVDRVDLAAHEKRRLFQSTVDPYETVVAMLDERGDSFLVRRQSPSAPPDLFVRRLASHELRQLTHFVDPAPALRSLHPRVVRYRRADGVTCSFTLYLPPDARPGTPLPTLLWAYPYEFEDRTAASQNANFVQRFDEPRGPVARLAALAGFAVLDDVSMPIVGDPKIASDTLVAQLTMDARAAIDEAVALGVTDRKRVAVGGHSYGAYMAATLLAHTRLFRAGIARSGAYNRTLTPFGFQNESRSYWEAPDAYARLSPFAFADRIAAPLLLVHGERDDNPATPAEQSIRLYDAIRGNGGTVRLVLYPDEAHAYVSREAVTGTEAEMIAWLDRYLAP